MNPESIPQVSTSNFINAKYFLSKDLNQLKKIMLLTKKKDIFDWRRRVSNK